jgi:hypothetical protein
MGSVDSGNILLLLVIWRKQSRRGLRNRQRTLRVEIRGNFVKRGVFQFGVWTDVFPKLADNLGDGSKVGCSEDCKAGEG